MCPNVWDFMGHMHLRHPKTKFLYCHDAGLTCCTKLAE